MDGVGHGLKSRKSFKIIDGLFYSFDAWCQVSGENL